MKTAVITGITGQDGSYLAELLLAKGYKVVGIIRRSSSFNTGRIDHIFQDPHEKKLRLKLIYGDLSDTGILSDILLKEKPQEIYNLGAQSHVRVSFDIPETTTDITAMGVIRLLETIRRTGIKTRFYQASSSEMFGRAAPAQNEATPFCPASPYACAKVYAHYAAQMYRQAYGMHIVSGILFNHESPRRGETFVSRKITRAAAKIKLGLQDLLYLGNLKAKRDWGYAKEYVEAMWLMLQQKDPDDFVIATGESHSVQEFAELAFDCLGLDWKRYVRIDPRYFRPLEVENLRGDASKAKRKLGWSPKIKFHDLVRLMVEADLEDFKGQLSGAAARQVRREV